LEAQKSEIESLENQLKASEQKRLASDKENRLLKQENEVLKLKSHMDTKDQTAIKENIIQQLAEVSSKIVSLRVSSNVVKGSKADENNPENDICYDK
jgi:3-deoxy-D-arabino-heptulosonate 7-phosphate (DAHP) synthase